MSHKALEQSIKHWENNCSAKFPHQVNIGPDACALCVLYIKNNCRSCPVQQRTNLSHCRGTPYFQIEATIYDWERHPNNPHKEADYKEAAYGMLTFLRSLRPSNSKDTPS